MSAEEFVKGFFENKNEMLENCLNPNSNTMSAKLFHQLNLDSAQQAILKQAVDCLLTDTYYTILMGLEGEASIGHWQHHFKIYDESGIELTGGEIEAKAYEYFHGNR